MTASVASRDAPAAVPAAACISAVKHAHGVAPGAAAASVARCGENFRPLDSCADPLRLCRIRALPKSPLCAGASATGLLGLLRLGESHGDSPCCSTKLLWSEQRLCERAASSTAVPIPCSRLGRSRMDLFAALLILLAVPLMSSLALSLWSSFIRARSAHLALSCATAA
eukprot:5573928-Prymnesium_polylepis.1